MKNQRSFLKCDNCGNIIGVIDVFKWGRYCSYDEQFCHQFNMFCCGQPMKLVAPNTEDAPQEKHLPVAKREGDKLIVSVGSDAHPMTEAHHISWIAVAQGSLTQRFNLEKTGPSSATFLVSGDDITVYAYCNNHGLWAADV
jgi:superoxide reductase